MQEPCWCFDKYLHFAVKPITPKKSFFTVSAWQVLDLLITSFHYFIPSFILSINQPTNQSINQSISQSINHSSIHSSTHPPAYSTPKGLFTHAILCLAIDILKYVFNWRECPRQTAANLKRISCFTDCHEFITYTRVTIIRCKMARVNDP